MGLAGKGMREGNLAQRFRTRFRNLEVAIAQRRAPQPGQAFDVALALVVEEIDALALIEDRGSHFAVARQVGVGVDHRLDVAVGHV